MKNEVVDPQLTTKIVTSYVRHHTLESIRFQS